VKTGVGSMSLRITATACAPYALTVVAIFFLVAQHIYELAKTTAVPSGTTLLGKCLYAAIIIFYLTLPVVSRNIFLSRQCESFGYDDVANENRGYLIADLDVRCNSADPEYEALNSFFWSFFVLWPVLVPLFFLGLVLLVRRAVMDKQITSLANACKFLWADYKPNFLFWEVVNMHRKLLLVALILFVDTENGSSRMLRLVFAVLIQIMYLAILAVARPFQRTDDFYIACLSNLLLACCFTSGNSIHIFFLA
jgi:hypothetical protein